MDWSLYKREFRTFTSQIKDKSMHERVNPFLKWKITSEKAITSGKYRPSCRCILANQERASFVITSDITNVRNPYPGCPDDYDNLERDYDKIASGL